MLNPKLLRVRRHRRRDAGSGVGGGVRQIVGDILDARQANNECRTVAHAAFHADRALKGLTISCAIASPRPAPPSSRPRAGVPPR